MFHVKDSHEVSSFFFSKKMNEKYLKMSFAAVVIGALRVKIMVYPFAKIMV